MDLLQITDLYTTAARLGGALDHIPSDRVTDGVDQAALLLLGEGHGRRTKIFHYSGDHLGALRRGDVKAHFLGGASGGLPKMEAYNVMHSVGACSSGDKHNGAQLLWCRSSQHNLNVDTLTSKDLIRDSWPDGLPC